MLQKIGVINRWNILTNGTANRIYTCFILAVTWTLVWFKSELYAVTHAIQCVMWNENYNQKLLGGFTIPESADVRICRNVFKQWCPILCFMSGTSKYCTGNNGSVTCRIANSYFGLILLVNLGLSARTFLHIQWFWRR